MLIVQILSLKVDRIVPLMLFLVSCRARDLFGSVQW